ncbi:Rpn family recombination-promoting nuclease/putative transposase [Nostoc sp. FACHB-152]|uniref:Rpn family recombination-promoting nuclease/putative transposase n=1 Tax=unclassified Nostoc TaxID=2593658 RepID=UPI001688163C|nr:MULTISPECIES: Rpn family recombination-promoting nuclease/putative transposase [unclassified Nostoc]MBD2451719.1 Rpn family recombination-promoting nuclease/putative transposase [Nostoc sp. FACHB-152]MBD2473220.1 Rpn family recombination-promoting nuclease/putative transposase [Nostoc sp. FACHB-145]
MLDNTCKLIAELYSPDFATWLLGEPIALTVLSPTGLTWEPMRTDGVILLQSNEVVLHIEFQTQPDENLPCEMVYYYLRIYERFPDKQIHQVVIYLEKTTSEQVYNTTFSIKKLHHEFEVIRLWEQSPDIFLKSIGLLPFAVLSATDNKVQTLQQVAETIATLPQKQTQSHIAAATAILASLVLEEEIIERLLRKNVMRESIIYQSFEAERRNKKVREIATNLLAEGISVEVIARSTGLSLEVVQELQQQTSNTD